MHRFRDRRDAGRQLGALVAAAHLPDPVVLALPRGGVPVADEVAAHLGAPLDVLVARKVGAPGHIEYGIGAIAECGQVVADDHAMRQVGVDFAAFERLAAAERVELERRVATYRDGRTMVVVEGRTVVLVDDGIATGVTARAAILAARVLGAARVVLAVPTCAHDTATHFATAKHPEAPDDVVCVMTPHHFRAVGDWYDDFTQTSDEEVLAILARHHGRGSRHG